MSSTSTPRPGTTNRALASLFAASHGLIDNAPGAAPTGTGAAETGQADRSR